jgi:metal-responsive CopG/Arc/MetJ family transcriptional regulator
MKKGKAGRPPKTDADRLERMTVYLKKSDQARLEKFAERRGVDRSTVVRQLILMTLEQEDV